MLRACIVVCTTSFLIGTLATHWIADGLTLWKAQLTDGHLYTSAAYYSLLAQAPHEMGVAIAVVTGAGAATILWSVWDGRAGNLMFDGASLFLYVCALVVYIKSVIPNLTTNFSTPLAPSLKNAFPPELKGPTLDLATSHLVCSVALTGVLVLQAGRWWAEGEDRVRHRSASTTPSVRPRKRSGTPPVEPSSNRGSARRKDSLRRKRLNSSGRRRDP